MSDSKKSKVSPPATKPGPSYRTLVDTSPREERSQGSGNPRRTVTVQPAPPKPPTTGDGGKKSK